MIKKIRYIDNTGLFLHMSEANSFELKQLNLIYAENGRGKTTLTSIFRSLMTGDPTYINERRKIGIQSDPHVIFIRAKNQTIQFQNGLWNMNLPEVRIYDDVFVANNVCSGLKVDPNHRQNLHELIIGEQGVSLNEQQNKYIEKIEKSNLEIKNLSNLIPIESRYGYSVDDYCNLPQEDDIDTKITVAEKELLAAQNSKEISDAALFTQIQLPDLNQSSCKSVLASSLETLDSSAVQLVKDHFSKYSPSPEEWISQGMSFLKSVPKKDEEDANANDVCPFCSQSLQGSNILLHYRIYFGAEYKQLIRTLSDEVTRIKTQCGEEKLIEFERTINTYNETHLFWSKYVDIPKYSLVSKSVIQNWKNLRNMILSKLKIKQASPLDIVTLTEKELNLFSKYESIRQAVDEHNKQVTKNNLEINAFKQKVKLDDTSQLSTKLKRLKAIKSRFSHEISQACKNYQEEKNKKKNFEKLKESTREELKKYRNCVFPKFNTAVNHYLQVFNAGFRLSEVKPANVRVGSTCNYDVLIDNKPISLTSKPGTHSFGNTLSSGDRNSLALAFFFATLKDEPNLKEKIIIIDDPVSTLDEHRTQSTAQEIRRLTSQVKQVIVLSHSKSFLCSIWAGAGPDNRASLQINRNGTNSIITDWNVENELLTEHDRLYRLLDAYIRGESTDSREVSIAIRPYLEGFLRVRCPKHFVPGTLLGKFINKCRQMVKSKEPIFNDEQIDELEKIKEYANRFHHNTNPDWDTAQINDGELNGFARRALIFTGINISCAT